jgi:deazaflavin-dependent oxidoreductase (nitroreductase family)
MTVNSTSPPRVPGTDGQGGGRRAPGQRPSTSISEINDNPLRRFLRTTSAMRPISRLYRPILHHIDRGVYRLTGGRATFAAWAACLPVIMLETTGARSGERRTLPMLGLPDGDDLVVIGTNYGHHRHPAWYHNLRAHPRARVTADRVTREVEASEVTDPAERDRIWARATRTTPAFAAYRERAGRNIPIIRLRPPSPRKES